MTEMNRRDRDQLAQVAKMRARVAKSSIDQRELVLRAEVEKELEALYNAERGQIDKALSVALEEAARYDKELQERLAASGIPEHLRPHLLADYLQHEGTLRERTASQRHAGLRWVAQSKIKALGAAARVDIDRQCADTVTALITGGLSGDDAQRFLDAMPTIDQLMLAPSVAELEAIHDEDRRQRRELGGGM